MAHSLHRLTSKLLNTPHLIDLETFENILSYLDDRNNFELSIETKSRTVNSNDVNYNPDTQVGMIDISGPLTYLEYQPICGEAPTSYQAIQSQFEALVEGGAKTIVLSVDSPGGMAYGMMELGRYMRTVADDKGIQLIGYCDGVAASAGYGLASCAHQLILNPESEAGSIGVVVRLRNSNEALSKAGFKDTYVYAGKSKIPYDEKGGFSESFLEDIQSKVDALYSNFVEFVSSMRQISPEAVRETEAKVFMAEDAVALGLADQVMTRESFFSHLADTVQRKDNNMLKTKLFKFNNKAELSAEEIETMTLEEMQASITALTEELTEVKTKSLSIESLVTQKDAELTSLQASLDEATQKLAQASDSAAKAEAEKVQAKLDARKADLALYLDAEKAEKAFATLANVDDSIFELSLNTFKSLREMETQSEAFKELGASGAGKDKSLDGKADGTAAALKAKYKKDSE